MNEQNPPTHLKPVRAAILRGLKQSALWIGITLAFLLVIGGLRGLHSGTQLYHFIIGLSRAGRGELAADWFVQTKNPWALFALLVEFTARYLGDPLFYVYQVMLVFVYLFSLIGLADHFFNIREELLKFFMFLALFLSSHAAFWPDNIGYTLYSGVATQSIPYEVLVPNSFGALLLLSVYLFFKQKYPASILAILGACYFHPSYLIAGAALVAGYLLVMHLDGKKLKQLALYGGSTLLLVLPLVIYFLLLNAGATQEEMRQATNITAGVRIAHHTQVAVWWDGYALIRLLIAVSALVAVRKSRLVYFLAVGLLFVVIPIAVLAIRPSNFLGALMLWRPSMVVVPISTTMLIASLVSGWYQHNRAEIKARQWLVVLGFSLLVLIPMIEGVGLQRMKIGMVQARRSDSLFQFVKEDLEPGDLYLLPAADRLLSPFRLETGAPVLADIELHPWGALDTLEWDQRMAVLDEFYSSDGDGRCEMIPELVDTYGVSHVVLPLSLNFPCPGWKTVFADDVHHLFARSEKYP